MGPLQIALLQAYKITNQKKSPIAGAINKLNKHNQALAKNVNETMERINKSGIKSDVLADSLSNATKSITPITQKATDVRVSILKSMPYQKLPDNYFADFQKIQGKTQGKKVEKDDAGKPKMVILPVPLEKPIAALAEAAANIQNATFTRPETARSEQIRRLGDALERSHESTRASDFDAEIPLEVGSGEEIGTPDLGIGTILEKPEQVMVPEAPSLDKAGSSKGIAPEVKPKRSFKLKDLSFSKKQSEVGIEVPKKVAIKDTAASTVPFKTIDKGKYIAQKGDLIDLDRPKTITQPISEEELPENMSQPSKDRSTLSGEHLGKEIERERTRQMKRATPGPLIPIMGALGLLAGTTSEVTSIVKRSKALDIKVKPSSSSVKDLKTGMVKTEETVVDVKLPAQEEMVKEPHTAAPSLEKPEASSIGTDEMPAEFESDITPVDLDETSEIPPTEKRFAVDESKGQVEGGQIPSADDYSKQAKTSVINWAPIAAALGSIGGIAATAVATNIHAKKQQLTPQPETLVAPSARKIMKTGEETLRTPEVDKTIIKTIRAPERKITGKVQEKETEKELMVKIPAKGSSISEPGLGYTKPIPTMVPAVGALGLLSFIAKKTVTSDQPLLKPLAITSSGLRDEEKSVAIFKSKRIEKRIPMEKANVPVHTGFALKDLNKVAVKTRDKLFIDDIKPVKKQGKVSPAQERIKLMRALGKIRRGEGEGEVQIPEPTGFKRKMLIDGGAIGALGLLNSAAVTTSVARATTIAEVYSKPKYRPELPMDISRLHSKLPVTKSLAVQTRPDIEAVRGQFADQDYSAPGKSATRAGLLPPIPFGSGRPMRGIISGRARVRMEPGYAKPEDRSTPNREALNILNLVAASAVRSSEQRESSRIPMVQTRRGITDVDHSIQPKGQLRPGGVGSDGRPTLVKKLPIPPSHVTSPFQRLPSISDAMRLMQRRPEKVIGERTGGKTSEELKTLLAGKETIEAGAGVPTGVEGGSKSGIQQTRRPRARVEILKRRGYLDDYGRPLERPRISMPQPTSPQELTRSGAPSSKDFDWLPSGAPVKSDATREHIVALEEKVRELSEKLGGKESELLPANRKLQEVVHDPNLQIQLKKLFYESWLENMEKEIKRYGG